MLETVATYLLSKLGPQAKEVIVFIISMMPVLELRGGIIAGYAFGFPLTKTLLLAITGNLIPIPFILFFIEKIFSFFKQHNIFKNTITKIESRALAKSGNVSKAEFWGLVAFVGIPLPGTGAWSGSLIASLLDMDIKKASLAILIGIATAATIMSLATYGIINFVF